MELRSKLLFELEPVEADDSIPIEEPVKVDYKAGSFVGTAQLVYKFMEDMSIETDDGKLIYRGTMKPISKQMGISESYLFTISRLLLRDGAIKMLVRGAGGKQSVYELVRPLDDVVLDNRQARILTGKSMVELREAQMRQLMREVRELRDRVSALESKSE